MNFGAEPATGSGKAKKISRLSLIMITSALGLAAGILILPGTAHTQTASSPGSQSGAPSNTSADFLLSDRCLVCHSNMKTAKGEDFSIGTDWRASMMANAARDPYWQGSVRRETVDHPESSAAIQSDCASCHMPLQYRIDQEHKQETGVFNRLPLHADQPESAASADGVSCAVCHQVQAAGLGTAATYSGKFSVAPPEAHPRPVYGPYAITNPTALQLHVAGTGYTPTQAAHIRDASLCGSCHTLYTASLGPGGKQIGQFPEQMTYPEWLHSDYRDKQTCQQCHMPSVDGPTVIASVFGQPRDGAHYHTFVGANFLMAGMLNEHRDDLAVTAESAELTAAVARTTAYLQSKAARISVGPLQMAGGHLSFPVKVENLGGHKLPTAFPSRRAWLHVVVKTADGHIVFESGKLNADGSIVGNANDADPDRFSPHYTLITKADQVEIFEPIMGDSEGHVTTGLLTATQYLKDNRILPAGFDKKTAPPEIAVHGEAVADPNFVGGSSITHYTIPVSAAGPFHVEVELLYQPIGYRWAHNLAPYKAAEPSRFVQYFDQDGAHSALALTHTEAATGSGK